MNEILIVDLSPFFGGGQKFIENIFLNATHADSFHFFVADEKLYSRLVTEKKKNIGGYTVFEIIKSVNSFIAQNGIKNVLLNGNRPIYFAPFIRAENVIAYRHTSNNAFVGVKKIFGSFFLNFCFFWCDKVVVLYKNAIKEIFQKSKVIVINNGINLPISRPKIKNKVGENVVICISRLEADKGIEWLIREFDNAFQDRPDVVLMIAGDGVLKKSLANSINGMKSRIELLGFVTDVNALLAKADLFILPSKYESFPLSILEAMSYSLPIIATDTGGVAEMVEDKTNGFLIDYGTRDKLGEKISYIISNPLEKKKMGEMSHNIIEKFSIDNCVYKIESLMI